MQPFFFFLVQQCWHLQSGNLERGAFLKQQNNGQGGSKSIKRESRTEEENQGVCISVMLVLVPEINSSTSLQFRAAGEASEELQCTLNINRPPLQMHSRHLGAPVGRFLLLQPFMETPREQMSTSYGSFTSMRCARCMRAAQQLAGRVLLFLLSLSSQLWGHLEERKGL